MTVIAAYYDKAAGRGAMASDSVMTGTYVADYGAKYRRIGSYLIGTSGSTVGDAFLATAYREEPEDSDHLLDFAQMWRAWAVDRGHTEQLRGLRSYPSHFLAVGPGGIFEIDGAGELLRHSLPYVAIGIGAELAMGAMFALHSLPECIDREPNVVVSVAVQAALRHGDGCGGRLHVETIDIAEPRKKGRPRR